MWGSFRGSFFGSSQNYLLWGSQAYSEAENDGNKGTEGIEWAEMEEWKEVFPKRMEQIRSEVGARKSKEEGKQWKRKKLRGAVGAGTRLI